MESAKLKESMAKQDKELLLSSRLMSEVQCKASEASMARAWAESKLAKLTNELNNLKVEHTQLQEDNSIIKEDLGQLEEKHSEVLEQLKASWTSTDQVEKCKTVVEEKYQHFQGKYTKMRAMLKEAKAANYLCQLFLALWIRDST